MSTLQYTSELTVTVLKLFLQTLTTSKLFLQLVLVVVTLAACSSLYHLLTPSISSFRRLSNLIAVFINTKQSVVVSGEHQQPLYVPLDLGFAIDLLP